MGTLRIDEVVYWVSYWV